MTSGQETERVYSNNPGAHMGPEQTGLWQLVVYYVLG